MRLGHLFAWGGLLLALMVTSAQAERRLAFVAGVNAYSNLPANMQLERAVADAETVSTTLQELGFSVTKLTAGVTHEAFLRRFGAFTAQIEPGDTVLVFFASHGVGLSGTNYLLPADVPLPGGGDERLVRNRSIAETDLIEDVRGRGARVSMMVIDACRNNPFPRTGTRSLGLARGLNVKEPAEGVFSIYSNSRETKIASGSVRGPVLFWREWVVVDIGRLLEGVRATSACQSQPPATLIGS